MTIAVCFNCGATKFGALTPCFKCKVMPREVDDLAMSLALSDHYMSVDKLKEVGSLIQNGSKVVLREDQMQKLREAAESFQHILPRPDLRRRPATHRSESAQRPTKRSWRSRVFKGYFVTGCLFGTIMWASYLYPVVWSSKLTFWERVSAIPVKEPMAILSGGVRIVAWGPSLVVWWHAPNDYSFGKWLAPGFYAEPLQTAATTKTSSAPHDSDRYWPKNSSSGMHWAGTSALAPARENIAHGEIRRSSLRTPLAPFSVRTTSGASYYFKLVRTSDDQDEVAGFIVGGEPFSMKVPLGTYELRYAVGQSWINDEEYFGSETAYLKADKKLTFSSDGVEVRGVAVELILQRSGNLTTSRIAKGAF